MLKIKIPSITGVLGWECATRDSILHLTNSVIWSSWSKLNNVPKRFLFSHSQSSKISLFVIAYAITAKVKRNLREICANQIQVIFHFYEFIQ